MDIKSRVINEANYIINTKNTIRQTAKYFNKSKSTIHDDLHNKLKKIDKSLYEKVSDKEIKLVDIKTPLEKKVALSFLKEVMKTSK